MYCSIIQCNIRYIYICYTYSVIYGIPVFGYVYSVIYGYIYICYMYSVIYGIHINICYMYSILQCNIHYTVYILYILYVRVYCIVYYSILYSIYIYFHLSELQSWMRDDQRASARFISANCAHAHNTNARAHKKQAPTSAQQWAEKGGGEVHQGRNESSG